MSQRESTNPMRKPRQRPTPPPTQDGLQDPLQQPALAPAPGVGDPAARTPTDKNWPPRTGPLFLLVLAAPLLLLGVACTAPALLLQREAQTATRAAQARPTAPGAKACLDAAKAADNLLHQGYPAVTRAADDAVYHMREACKGLTKNAAALADGGSPHG